MVSAISYITYILYSYWKRHRFEVRNLNLPAIPTIITLAKFLNLNGILIPEHRLSIIYSSGYYKNNNEHPWPKETEFDLLDHCKFLILVVV